MVRAWVGAGRRQRGRGAAERQGFAAAVVFNDGLLPIHRQHLDAQHRVANVHGARTAVDDQHCRAAAQGSVELNAAGAVTPAKAAPESSAANQIKCFTAGASVAEVVVVQRGVAEGLFRWAMAV